MEKVSLILRLSINDFKAKYAASVLGIIWAFVQPIITILVFWFVYQVGFKSSPVDDIPYILWFIVAYIPWIYFSDMLSFGVNSLSDYSYLVKKVKFKVEYLPTIRIISLSFVHMFFVAFIFFIFKCYNMPLSIFNIQVIYYSIALTAYSWGLVLFLSALSVFFRDISQIVMIVLQIGFWATPIFWNINDIENEAVIKIIKLNPIYYIVEGYRDSFIYNIPFWKHVEESYYFWGGTLVIGMLGYFVFKRLRPHFADEL